MVVLQVNCRYTVSRAEWEQRYTDAAAAKFLDVAGLVWKIWLDGEDEPRGGGVYLFETMAHAKAYLDGPIIARLKANPAIEDLEFRLSNVRERMTAITNGPVPGLASGPSSGLASAAE
jgi:hypothetical protein